MAGGHRARERGGGAQRRARGKHVAAVARRRDGERHWAKRDGGAHAEGGGVDVAEGGNRREELREELHRV